MQNGLLPGSEPMFRNGPLPTSARSAFGQHDEAKPFPLIELAFAYSTRVYGAIDSEWRTMFPAVAGDIRSTTKAQVRPSSRVYVLDEIDGTI